MKTHIDLRCSRRLTVREGRLILDALDFAKVNSHAIKTKIAEAILLATHTCNRKNKGKCDVCGETPEQRKRAVARRASDLRSRLSAADDLQKREMARRREESLRNPPSLRFVREDGGST